MPAERMAKRTPRTTSHEGTIARKDLERRDQGGKTLETGLARYRTWPSLTSMFFEQATFLADRPLAWRKVDGVYQPTSWKEAAKQVRALAQTLRSRGVSPGERIALIAENRPEWLIADLAIMAAGAITVPAYTTYTVTDYEHLLADSGATAVVVSSSLRERVLAAGTSSPFLRAAIVIDGFPSLHDGPIDKLTWDEALAEGARGESSFDLPQARRQDPACIIYTSGSGGAPKGVVLSHGAILCNCMGAFDLLHELGLDDEVFLSFLPLSHAYEHTAGQFFPLSIGAQIYYAESAEALGRNMIEARPTIMTAVPRLYETLHARILHGLRKTPPLRRKLFDKALTLGRKRYEGPNTLTLTERVQDVVLDRLVRRKVRDRFGGRIKALVSGGAPLNVELGTFFTALGLRLLQGYGQTESAPVVSCNRPHKIRIETVGPPLRDVRLRLAEDGEILVAGELVMTGYWNNAEATELALRDGWLHTGDIGVIDDDGYLRITDRKKDIIVTSGGDNVAPQRVEGFLSIQPEIAQAMVFGDRRPYLVAVIVPEAEFAARWAKTHGHPISALGQDPEFRKAIAAAVDRVNRELAAVERVRRFILSAEEFTVENNMLTPSLKIRRHVIRTVYRGELEALY